jgi:hypothetical protein
MAGVIYCFLVMSADCMWGLVNTWDPRMRPGGNRAELEMDRG